MVAYLRCERAKRLSLQAYFLLGALAACSIAGGSDAFAQVQRTPPRAEPVAAPTPDQPLPPPLADLDSTVDTLVVEEANLPPPPATPEVFGTSAVLATRTTMDERWRRVHAPPADGVTLRALVAGTPDGDRLRQAAFVEQTVSKRIAFRSDWDNWQAEDYWATPDEVLARGAGDCEDSAIVKLAALRLLGFADRDLYLMIGKNRAGLEHAVLLVRIDSRFWVLDDGATRIEPAEGFDTFEPLMTFAANSAWIHGRATKIQRPVDWAPDLGEPDPSLTLPLPMQQEPRPAAAPGP